MTSRAALALAPALALLTGASALSAQEGVEAPAACDGQAVVAVELRQEEPAILGGRTPGWARPILRVALQSRRSDTTAVRPFVLLAPGDGCTEFARSESERLLRAQPYLADARVTAVPEAGGVRLVVETTDEIPIIVGGSVQDGQPSRLLFGNGNVMGRGMLAAAQWEQGFAYRDGFGAHLAHYHAFGGRRRVELHGVRGPLSEWYQAGVAMPYLTDAQRLAWAAGYARSEGYLGFPRPGRDALSLGTTRDVWGLAGLARVGSRNRRLLVGASLGYERGEPADSAVVISDTGLVASADDAFRERFAAFRATRVAAIVGTRLLGFRRVEGLDAVAGSQDLPNGVQLLATLGYELGDERRPGESTVEASQPFAIVDLYAGRAYASGLSAFALAVEGRKAASGDGWDDVVANGRVASYHKPSRRRMRMVSLEYQGAWKTRRPYRVLLANWNGGVRGYGRSRAAGARLAVIRVEERLAMGGIGSLVGFGGAAFTDVGKLWADDVPYGRTTSLRPSAGVALLAAVPRRSQAHYRLDVVAPLARDRDAESWTLRVSRVVPYQAFLRETADLARARSARPASMLITSP